MKSRDIRDTMGWFVKKLLANCLHRDIRRGGPLSFEKLYTQGNRIIVALAALPLAEILGEKFVVAAPAKLRRGKYRGG